MSVDRVSVKRSTTGSSFVNIPIDLTFQIVDNYDAIEGRFVNEEIEKVIGEIQDNEVARFHPFVSGSTGNEIAKVLRYKCNFFDPNLNHYFNFGSQPTTYGDIGFLYDDIFLRKNNFTKSFLRLDFFNNDRPTENTRVLSLFLKPRIYDSDVLSDSTIVQPSVKEVVFELKTPILSNNSQGEGYFINYKKNSVSLTESDELFMRASFYNAKTGIVKQFSTIQTAPGQIPLDILIDTLYTRYIFKKYPTGHRYIIDPSYSMNVVSTNTSFNVPSSYDITLYETVLT